MINEIYKLSNNYALYNYDSEKGPFLLFNFDTGIIYHLNKVAYSMIELIDGVRSMEDVLQLLFLKYQAPQEEIKNDFSELLKKWIDNEIEGRNRLH